MDWIDNTLDALTATTEWGYHVGAPSATEPVALAAMALTAHGRIEAAAPLTVWLEKHRNPDGSLGVTAAQDSPCWPTSLAMLAWLGADHAARQPAHAEMLRRAADWTLAIEGVPIDMDNEMGHNSRLIGWPWVETTHSWIEPTAQHVLALKAVGMSSHARTREAVRLLSIACCPTGAATTATRSCSARRSARTCSRPASVCWRLADEPDVDGRIGKSIDYLLRALNQRTATASLCYGLTGPGGARQQPDRC